MTLIWATKIKNKWTILADDWVTIWQILTSSSETYRPKLRKIQWKNVELIVTWCWTLKDVDFMTNMIEEALSKHKIKDTKELKFFLQQTVAAAHKALEWLTDKPQQTLLILEPKTDTLFIADEYSVTQPIDSADIVTGSAEQMFYKLHDRYDFLTAFIRAVEADEYCKLPVVTYRDWAVDEYRNAYENNKDDFYKFEDAQPVLNEYCNTPVDTESYDPKVCLFSDSKTKSLN